MSDDVNHPSHYTQHPSGVECITVTEHMTFNLGNAVKYIWRAGLKSPDAIRDLEKARWYINRELGRLARGEENSPKEHRAVASPAANGLGILEAVASTRPNPRS